MNLLDLFVKVAYDDKDVDKGIEGTVGKSGKFGQTLAKGFGAVTAAVGVISTGLIALGTAGLKYNAQMEQYQTSFEVMLGSEEKAIALTEKLKEKAAATPFEMTDLAKTTQLLFNYGVSADEVVDKMGMLGDISQGSAEKLNGIALAYGQMSSLGKVQLQDIKQMIGAGFNPLQEISERTGESMESLYSRISKGTLAVDEITASMEASTSEGGKYFQSMEKQGLTFNGLMSTLKDTAMGALGSITSGLSDIATESVLPQLIGYVTELSTAFEEGGFEGLMTKFGDVLGEIVTSIAEAAPQITEGALGLLGSFGTAIINNLPTIIPVALEILMQLVNGILESLPVLVEAALEILVSLATGIAEQLPTLIPTIVEVINTIIDTLIENIPMLIDASIQLLMGLADGIITSLPILAERVPEIVLALINAIVENLPLLLTSGVDIMVAIANAVITAIPTIIAAIPEILMAVVQAFADLAPQVWEAGTNLVNGIWEGISAGTQWIYDKISGWVGGVIDWIKSLFGIASPSKEMADGVGKYISEGVGEGITDNVTAVTDAAGQLSDAVVAEAESMNQAGVTVVDALGKGMLSRIVALGQQFRAWFVQYVILPIRTLYSQFYETGRYMSMGFIIGMLSRRQEIIDDAKGLAIAANNAFRAGLRVRSPSKATYEAGEYFVTGFTNTINNGITDVRSAVGEMSSAALSFGSDVTQGATQGQARTGNTIGGMTFNFNQPVTSPTQTANRISRELAGVLYA